MEVLKDWVWPLVGGGAVVGLLLLVYGIGGYIAKWRHASHQAATEAERRAYKDAWEAHKARKLGEVTYEDRVKAWNRLMVDREKAIRQANQDAQARCVEDKKPTLLTIFDYYEAPDDQPIFKIEDCPLDDPRRAANQWGCSALVVDDQRSLPHEQFGYSFMPAHLREQWVTIIKSRRDAIKKGSLKQTWQSPTGKRQATESPTILKLKSTDDELQGKIDTFTQYQTDLNGRADKAFHEELEKLKAEAEAKARFFMAKPERRKLLDDEARERQVDIKVVEDEFISLVVSQMTKGAREAYGRPNPNVLAALTSERIVSGDMFTH